MLVAAAFPVSVSADGRYLQDARGAPFPLLGRTAWFVISAPQSDARRFLRDTVERGFDAIEMHVLDHDPRGNRPPFDGRGDLPFRRRLDGAPWNGALAYGNISAEAPDFTSPDERYWEFADAFLDECERRGLLVLFFPAYVGYQGGEQGWMREMVANGPDRVRAYGAFVGSRYRERANLVWMMGGDMGTAPNLFDPSQTAVEQALIDGIRQVRGKRSLLFSAEWSSDSICTDQVPFGAFCSVNGAYSWTGAVTPHIRRAYQRSPPMPAFLLEEPYDEEGRDGNGVNPHSIQPVRRYEWAGWLGGIAGYVAGNGYVWAFRPGEWDRHLGTQGARDLARLNAFVRSVAWNKLVPSGLAGTKSIVVAGGSMEGAPDWVPAAAARDGSLLVAYVPPGHHGPISVDMTVMSAPSRARWLNPAKDASVAAGVFPNAGVRTFAPPGDNGTGTNDWVLVIETEPSR